MMKNKKKVSHSTKVTAILMVAAVVLLMSSALGSTRAEIGVSQIGVSLLENGNIVGSRDYSGSGDVWNGTPEGKLLTGLLGENEEFVIGKKYDEVLSVRNTGTIDEYVRVRLYKSWQYGRRKQPSPRI